MAKTKMSCFKIMACASSEADEDIEKHHHLPLDENTTSSDKSRWSFRKRSTRHRVLSNTVITEPVAVICNQENKQSSVDNFQSPKHSCTEKTSIQEKNDENSSLQSTVRNEEVSTVRNEEVYPSVLSSKPSTHESDAVVIQAHIRGYLARKEYKRTKSAIKLQAAVRGHLVRRKAVGTLRCVQAIIKMQALIRARYTHRSVEGFSALEAKENPGKQSPKTLLPSEKLLTNGFARQLLMTASSTKPIGIKCQPSKSDSAWKWMERWMIVTSSNFNKQNEKDDLKENSRGLEECTMLVDLDAENEVISKNNFTVKSGPFSQEDTGSISIAENISGPGDQEPENNLENSLNSSLNHYAKKSPLQNEVAEVTDKNAKLATANEKDMEPQLDYQALQSNPCLKQASDSFSNKPYRISEHSTKEESSETAENEGKPSAFDRKSFNPIFAAVKSKFEELSLSSTVSKSIGSFQDDASKQKFDSQKAPLDSLAMSKEKVVTESSVLYDTGVQAAASECGTEISISSTLDSPDRSETDGGEIVLEIGGLEKENNVISSASDEAINITNMDTKVKSSTIESESSLLHEHEKGDEHLASFVLQEKVHSLENLSEPVTSVMPNNKEREADEKVKSPEGTPRSQAVVTDLHGTPSSQVSLDTNVSKNSGLPTHKRKKQITARNSSSSPSKGSGERTSIEQLSKEAKHAKRRHSFATSKPDQVDKELKTTSSSSLPSYMQATASARAKSHANASPKLSPDVQENLQTRKRHSLPIENGKQSSSPRMQRSASQAQQKPNETHSPQNLSERRWQR